MPKVCVMDGVREHAEDYPVEVWRNDRTGRLVIRAVNEGGNNITEVDLLDLLEWLRTGPPQRVLPGVDFPGKALGGPGGDDSAGGRKGP